MCAFAFVLTTRAQQTNVRLEGTVVDQTGAGVAGARVRIGGATRVTDAEGRFVFADVDARGKTISVSAQGFKPTEQRWNGETALHIVLAAGALAAEEVTVSASRTQTRLSETAASVVVLGAADLATTAALTLDDTLRQVPGFQLFRRTGSRAANPTAQGVSLRGVGASGASRALVLADGVPLNDPFGGWVYWDRVPRASINRVEVLRGGASDLYGSAALGGVINVLTKEPRVDSQLAFDVSYGNQLTPSASLYAGTRRGRWVAALAAESFYTDGYILTEEDARGRVDTPARSKHTTLDFTLSRYFAADKGRVFLRGNVFGEVRANGTPLQNNRTHARQLSAGGERRSARFGWFLARAYTSAQIYDQDFSAVAADRNSESLTRSQRVPAQIAGLTLQWSRAIGNRNALVAGADAQIIRGASDERIFVGNRVTSLVGAGGREKITGFFAQDIVRLTNKLLLTIGARLDSWRNYEARSTTRPAANNAPSVITVFPARTEHAFSPRASLLYRVGERTTFNAAMYRAFRAPTLNELYRTFRVGDVQTLANENLRAERLTGGEVGINSNIFGKVNLRGVGFWSDITRPVANVTLRTTPALITRQRRNLGRTRSRGIELEMSTPLGEHWTFSGGYAFTDTAVTRFPADTALEGLRLPQVPRHQLTLQARYTNPRALNFSVQTRALGSQYDDDRNLYRLDSFATFDAFASRALTRHVELFAAAENIFNRRYEVGRTPLVTLGQPATVRAGLRLQLGAK